MLGIMMLPQASGPDDALNARAAAVVQKVLNDSDVVASVRSHCATGGDFAGRTFTTLEPNNSDSITTTDVLAVMTLSVVTRPRAIPRFVQDAEVLGGQLARLDRPNLRLEN